MFKLDLEKAEEAEIKLPTSIGSSKKQENSRKYLLLLIDYAKAFDCVDHKKLWKILKEMGIPDHLAAKICMQVKKQQLELDMEQQTDSKLRKEYVKAVYCHPVYLTYMQSTACEMLGWMKHKLKSSPEKYQHLSYADDITLMTESEEELKRLLWQKLKRN